MGMMGDEVNGYNGDEERGMRMKRMDTMGRTIMERFACGTR